MRWSCGLRSLSELKSSIICAKTAYTHDIKPVWKQPEGRRRLPPDVSMNRQGNGVDHMWGIIIALVSGALMSVQGVFNTEVTKQTSLWVSSAFVQLTALIVCLGAWLVTDRTNFMKITQVDPKYMLLGGAIGAFITITVVKSMDSLGPARAAMLIVIAQLIVAYVIELMGLFGVEKQPFEWRKAIGMAVAIAGIVIFKW